jgi:DNA helicase-2/ATP-dependent DNA helicase PcrA
LLRRHIPYRVVGSLKFYEREEVKDALALLSLLVNPRDEVAFRRIVNKPTRGVGAATVGRVAEEASAGSTADGNLFTAAQRLLPMLSKKARSGLEAFWEAIEAGRAALDSSHITENTPLEETEESPKPEKKSKQTGKKAKTPGDSGQWKDREGLRAGEGLSVCVVSLVLNTGIAEYHLIHDEIKGNQRINNLQELANVASLYPATTAGLLEFLEHIELDRSLENVKGKDKTDVHDMVTLITLHNTKGLEFRRVIMTGVEQGVFPREDKKGEELEEERRLFYVGATRAMDELYLCSCASRRMYGRTMPMNPSLFLYEIDKTCLRVIGSPPQGYVLQQTPHVQTWKSKAHTGSPDQWEVGNRLFHEDQGYGSVIEIQESPEGPVIRVHFDTGKELRFLSLYQGSRITRINQDD